MRTRGFTLIEVLVVIVIMGVTSTAVVFSIEGIRSRSDANELQRLRLVLELAGERAAVTGTPISVQFLPDHYRFSTLAMDGSWRLIQQGDSLAERKMPEGFAIEKIIVNGRAVAASAALVLSTEMPDFEIHVRTPENQRILRSHPEGSVSLDLPAQGSGS